jgi:TRAP-type C4-dicarboxylate transport system permease small subunit
VIERLLRILQRLLEALAVTCLALVLAIVFMQVVFRYVFQVSVPFTEEAARYLGVWLVFTGGAALVASNGHIKLTFLVDLARGRARTGLMALAALLVLVFNLILLVGGLDLIPLNWNQSATTLPMPVSVLYIAVALCAACSILFVLHQLWSWLRDRR